MFLKNNQFKNISLSCSPKKEKTCGVCSCVVSCKEKHVVKLIIFSRGWSPALHVRALGPMGMLWSVSLCVVWLEMAHRTTVQ